ncbi:hypothetical protein CFI00_21645 [Nocardioides sp. S5]|uniref:Ig-like domain repeat protein n=1 Tax=Nocardioides sp. S5 TaxID=2017486 RepID=UPI001A8CFA15|nr:Ig-like domain repeat protein [Nocardioides sp. S5]QSR33059.1 hypothetical protein CFI00_21645 [Nocardioides sp. S5]
MSTSWSTTGTRRLVHTTVAAAVAAVALQAVPASAAVSEPRITGPSGDTGPSVELSWEPVEKAVGYEVRVDNDPAFGSAEWTSATVNTVSVPTKLLGKGQQYMGVRAKDSTGAWSDWATSAFTVTAAAGPVLLGPDDGITLAQPADPPLLTWAPVSGAASYTVEVDDEPGFVSPSTYPTEATALVVPNNQAPDVTYYWRVRADLADGFSTDYSDDRSYTVAPIVQPTIIGPSTDEDVIDVVLDWSPVPGAKYYELEVDDDVNFGSPVDSQQVPAQIYGTRFSPKTTLGNGQYYWRVRARDLDNNPTEWVRVSPDEHYFFDRQWRDKPQLVYPYDPAGTLQHVSNDLYYEWEPVPHASNYEVWLSTDPNFTDDPLVNPKVTWKCVVAGTTYTPGEIGPSVDACMPSAEDRVYYWKVRPMDRPFRTTGVEGIFSDRQSFVYTDQDAFSISTPQNGATVEVPTLAWAPINGTETYEVKLLQAGAVIKAASTHSTSYTPFDLKLDPAKGAFTWELRALDKALRTTQIASRTFTLSTPPDTSTPLELFPGPATYDAPHLRWGAMTGAEYYRIDIADAATGSPYADGVAPILAAKLYYPSATDTSVKFLDEGTYLWWVTAYSKDNQVLGTSSNESFVVQPLGPVTGQRLALSGSSLDAGAACTETLSNSGALCDGVPATPVLDWDPVPYASEYRVRVSRDPDFTSGELAGNPPRTVNTRWAPRAGYPFLALEESQANNAYYWFIQPCKSAIQCGPDPESTINPSRHAFRKSSPQVQLLSPAKDATTVTTEVTFEWTDYFDTNRAAVYDATDELSYQSAMRYRLQVDDDPAFGSPIDDVLVDQTTYTAADRLYREGPLWWRVRAIDANNNALAWSETRAFATKSPVPTLTSPVVTDGKVPVVTGAVPFRWEALPFAGGYDVQVAANADRNFSGANLKVNVLGAKRSAFTTGSTVSPTVQTLQAADSSYVWRVRRVDPDGNRGDWSAVGEFKVQLKQPTLTAPAAGTSVGPRGLVLRWGAVAEASKYRVELRAQGSYPTTTTTPATSWAPPTAMKVGTTYEWRVASVDVDGRYADPGAWRTFTIGGVPTATTPPSIDGTGVFDTTLVAVAPTWSTPDTTNTYQWRRNGAPVEGASGPTYVVRAQDVGASITVVATGTSAEFGTGTSTSAAVTGKPGAGATVTTAPTISGTGRVGTTLTSTSVAWDPAETETTLQWMRNGTAISSATSATYTVAPGDLNASITLRATGALPGREPTTASSNAITAREGAAPTATTPPRIQGIPKVGAVVTGTPPAWEQQGVQQSIQWLRNGQPISGQTNSSYTVRPEDLGASLTVRYTGVLPGRTAAVLASAPVTGLLGDAPRATSSPTVSGTRKVGTTLTGSPPTWNLTGVQQSIQWLRDGQPVTGQTTSSYTVRPEDLDSSLAVRYTGTLAGRASGTATSTAVVAQIGDAPTASVLPSVSGPRKVDTVLVAVPPTWNLPGVEQTIQWMRNGQPVAGGTGTTYAVRVDDVNASLTVRFTGTLPGRTTGTATSPPVTGVIGDAPTSPSLAAPSGTGRVGTALQAVEATWTPSTVTQTRQWLVEGQPVAGETGPTYVVRAADAGRRISVRVTATMPGHAPGTVTSAAVLATAEPTTTTTPTPTPTPTPAPATVASRTVLKAPSSVRVAKRAVVKIKVSATGIASPTGVVKIYAGRKLVAKVRLKAGAAGAAKVRLAKLAAGRYKLRADYGGMSGAKASSSKVVRIKVVR